MSEVIIFTMIRVINIDVPRNFLGSLPYQIFYGTFSIFKVSRKYYVFMYKMLLNYIYIKKKLFKLHRENID